MLSISSLNSQTDEQTLEYALSHDLNFALYRTPKGEDAVLILSDRLDTSVDETEDAFIATEFNNNDLKIIPADYKRSITISTSPESTATACRYTCPDMPRQYADALGKIISRLKREYGKTVFAVEQTVSCALSIYDIFCRLATAYPDAFVFCWHLIGSESIWIGATPELLCDFDGYVLKTVALAGTRQASITRQEWDDKNKDEQNMVVRFIEDIFNAHGLMPDVGRAFTQKAGNIEHICTEITSQRIPTNFKLFPFLSELSPTPAVSGFPRSVALAEINALEGFDRKYYAGYCGYIFGRQHKFYVSLRCMNLNPYTSEAKLYAGGGITAQSVPEDEWKEVNAKLNTLRKALNCS